MFSMEESRLELDNKTRKRFERKTDTPLFDAFLQASRGNTPVALMASHESAVSTCHVFSPIPYIRSLEFKWIKGPAMWCDTYLGIEKVLGDAILYVNRVKRTETVVFRDVQGLSLDIVIHKKGENWHILIVAPDALTQVLSNHCHQLSAHLKSKMLLPNVVVRVVSHCERKSQEF